jgi:hypothetical protein
LVYNAATSADRHCGSGEFHATRLDDIPAAAASILPENGKVPDVAQRST